MGRKGARASVWMIRSRIRTGCSSRSGRRSTPPDLGRVEALNLFAPVGTYRRGVILSLRENGQMTKQGVTRRLALKLSGAFAALGWLVPTRALAETVRRRLPWGADQSDRPNRLDDTPGYRFFAPA